MNETKYLYQIKEFQITMLFLGDRSITLSKYSKQESYQSIIKICNMSEKSNYFFRGKNI